MIDYNLVAQSNNRFMSEGYQYIDTPWTITQAVSEITKPPAAKDFKLVHDDNKVLVASGEQGFLYQAIKGFIPEGKFISTTPCFRKESHDAIHLKQFLKTEAIILGSESLEECESLIQLAYDNFSQILKHEGFVPGKVLTIVDETSSYASLSEIEGSTSISRTILARDILLAGTEIGYYGIRQYKHIRWIYGTVIAEPRFSNTMKAL